MPDETAPQPVVWSCGIRMTIPERYARHTERRYTIHQRPDGNESLWVQFCQGNHILGMETVAVYRTYGEALQAERIHKALPGDPGDQSSGGQS